MTAESGLQVSQLPCCIDAVATEVAETFAKGGTPDGVETLATAPRGKNKRDVFIYMISGAKVRAPAAAMALIERLK